MNTRKHFCMKLRDKKDVEKSLKADVAPRKSQSLKHQTKRKQNVVREIGDYDRVKTPRLFIFKTTTKL